MIVKDLIKLFFKKENDTKNSKKIFDLEEGKNYKYDKRRWIKKAGGVEKANQKFHAINFLKAKNQEANYTGLHLQNPALIIYLREVVNGENTDKITDDICKYYQSGNNNKINSPEVVKLAKEDWNGL